MSDLQGPWALFYFAKPVPATCNQQPVTCNQQKAPLSTERGSNIRGLPTHQDACSWPVTAWLTAPATVPATAR